MVDGGGVRLFPEQEYRFGNYDIVAHAAGVSRKYGIDVTPGMLEQATMSQDTHLGGCNLYNKDCDIVRERLLAIGRDQKSKGPLDYIFDGLEWLEKKISGFIGSIFGRRSARPSADAQVEQPVTSRIVGVAVSPEAGAAPVFQVVQLQTPQGAIPVSLSGPAALSTPNGVQAQTAVLARAPAMAPAIVLQGGLQMVAPPPPPMRPLLQPLESFIDVP